MIWESSETNDIKMFSEDYAVTMDKHTDDSDIIIFKVLYISSFNCILWGILDWGFMFVYTLQIPVWLYQMDV